MIPDDVLEEVRQALGQQVQSTQPVSGGSINRAAKITLKDGRDCFLKWNTGADPEMFVKEEKGLDLLRGAGTSLIVPRVFSTGATGKGTGFLMQEFIAEGRPGNGSAESFGKALADLHRTYAGQYGLDHDNFIGRLPQSNNRHPDWIDFFVEERMEPQLRRASDSGLLDRATVAHFKAMYKQLPDIFPDEPPSLLHGDLWGGNFFYDREGRAAIYDPAVYYGHREIELAFTHLFGGFAPGFYQSYETAYPLQPGFSERKEIYNLYPLLVHANLFGGSYTRQVASIVQRF